MWQASDIVLLAIIAVLLAVTLATPAAAIASNTPLPHWAALGLIVLGIVAVLSVGLWLAGEQVVMQFAALVEDLPAILERLQGTLDRMPGSEWLSARIAAAEPGDIAGIGVISQVTDAVGGAMAVLIRIVFVVFLALFLAAAPKRYRDGLVRLAPPRGQRRMRQVLSQLAITIQGWILGQMASMLLVGILATVGLMIIGVPYALLLGLIAGIAELIPIFGPIFAYVPAVIVAFADGPQQALWVSVLYLIIQQLEGNAIQPMVQRYAVDLPQALTVIAIILGESLFGVLGMFIATPVAASILVLVKMLYLHDHLGQSVELPGGESEP
ncbi:MAG: AI-2E family transporter [Trueperaceae bacterium]|nr:AI-2E family transporter [Trueperaceae bacterium]